MRRLLPLVLLLALLLTGCTARDPIGAMVSTATDLSVPAPASDDVLPREITATLWFRFSSTSMLAPELRALTLSPTAPEELTLLQALFAGPAASSLELTGLFPPGTSVLATHRQGRTLFVTLSRQIMNDYADEKSLTAAESALRRQLAMQAIVATATENCDVDSVVILVDHAHDGSSSLRLRQRYYRDGSDANALAAPLLRDETMLLTPANTLALALDCWQNRDWASLYPLVARSDASTGDPCPAYEDFAVLMAALPHLTAYTASPGHVSPDGQSALFTVTLTLQEGGTTHTAIWNLRLHRERTLWRMNLSDFTGREADLP